jgi:hypothetical protein
VRAIHAISNRQELNLVQTRRERCGVEYAEDLAIGMRYARAVQAGIR